MDFPLITYLMAHSMFAIELLKAQYYSCSDHKVQQISTEIKEH